MTSTVLVVDDQPEVRGVLRRLLEKTGYATAEAAGGKEAMEIVRQRPPDLVILDISMPEMSGLSVIGKVRESAPATKIVVLSSHEAMHDEVIALGADLFLPKTTPPRKLVSALAAVLP